MHPTIAQLLVGIRVADLRREADRARQAATAQHDRRRALALPARTQPARVTPVPTVRAS
jgi:hypothetical protein